MPRMEREEYLIGPIIFDGVPKKDVKPFVRGTSNIEERPAKQPMSEPITQEIASQVSRMYRVALRIVGCVETAQEVAQDACLKALRGAEKFNRRAGIATWLHRITVNCAHDHLRKRRQSERNQADWDKDTLGMLAALEVGPAQKAEQNELYRLAIGLVAKLPDDCRSAFILTQLDGYTYDEAAAIENLSRGTVASRVYRARQILMEQMNRRCAGESP
jgi:RNA polymerase sigma-70 factor, ECF subfamily